MGVGRCRALKVFFSAVSFLSQPLLAQMTSKDRDVVLPTPPQLHCLKLPWEISLQHELDHKAGWADFFLLKFRRSWLSHHLPYKYIYCLSGAQPWGNQDWLTRKPKERVCQNNQGSAIQHLNCNPAPPTGKVVPVWAVIAHRHAVLIDFCFARVGKLWQDWWWCFEGWGSPGLIIIGLGRWEPMGAVHVLKIQPGVKHCEI